MSRLFSIHVLLEAAPGGAAMKPVRRAAGLMLSMLCVLVLLGMCSAHEVIPVAVYCLCSHAAGTPSRHAICRVQHS